MLMRMKQSKLSSEYVSLLADAVVPDPGTQTAIA